MKIYSAVTTVSDRSTANAILDAFDMLHPAPGASGLHDRNDGSGTWDVSAYFEEKPDVAGLALIASLNSAPDFIVAPVENVDWVAQVRSELTPVRAGRFMVYGSHDRENVPSHLIGLEIEAAQAFGTGHHETTRGCLKALDGLVKRGAWPRNVADIGGGTGVLAMAAARVFSCPIIASDIDPVATETARENIRANRLGDRVTCVTAPGFNHPLLRQSGPYDLILSNILARPLKRLAKDMYGHTAPGGRVVLSGILARQVRSVESVYRSVGFGRDSIAFDGEWSVLVLAK